MKKTIILPVGFVVNTVCIPADDDETLINIDKLMACLLNVAASLAELKDILDDLPSLATLLYFPMKWWLII